MADTRIELHGKSCSCRGGAWVLLEATQRSPCSGGADDEERLVLGLDEWRQLGKPGSLEVFEQAQKRVDSGERRQFQRFEVALEVRLSRIPNWRDSSPQTEETVAEVIATGGALARSRMAVDKGEMIRFQLDGYETRAEVMYVSAGGGTDGVQRLGLKFLDAPLPESFIPADAQPLP
jgi:hypothetical protein